MVGYVFDGSASQMQSYLSMSDMVEVNASRPLKGWFEIREYNFQANMFFPSLFLYIIFFQSGSTQRL